MDAGSVIRKGGTSEANQKLHWSPNWCHLAHPGHQSAARCYPRSMTEETPNGRSQIDECIARLKSKIPEIDHGALESRAEELFNDPSTDADDVISILLQEFDPDLNPPWPHP
jgi:hypothetical protein